MRNVGLDEAQAETKIARRKINNLGYAEDIMQNGGWMKHKLESRLWEEISITSDMQMIPP